MFLGALRAAAVTRRRADMGFGRDQVVRDSELDRHTSLTAGNAGSSGSRAPASPNDGKSKAGGSTQQHARFLVRFREYIDPTTVTC